jgi:hypothetical protein
MMIFDLPADAFDELESPHVRDLAWVLTSAPLLHSIGNQRHPLSASAWRATPSLLLHWLAELDRDPTALLLQIERQTSRRLGHYYESLWQFALANAPDVNVVATNVPVRENGRTLGEMDLLYEDQEGLHHVEFSVKFYLGPERGDGLDPSRWCGTEVSDRLATKLHRLQSRQLPLSNTSQGRTAIAAFTNRAPAASLWMGGYLFYPPANDCGAPRNAHPCHSRGKWMRKEHWRALQTDGIWQPIPRSRWLSGAMARNNKAPEAEHFLEWNDERFLMPAKMLARLLPERGRWREVERILVVDDAWPASASTHSA